MQECISIVNLMGIILFIMNYNVKPLILELILKKSFGGPKLWVRITPISVTLAKVTKYNPIVDLLRDYFHFECKIKDFRVILKKNYLHS